MSRLNLLSRIVPCGLIVWSMWAATHAAQDAAEVVAEGETGVRLIAISAEINGEHYSLALDTGSAAHGFESDLLRKIGKDLGNASITTGKGESVTRVFLFPSITIAESTMPESYAVAVDVQAIAGAQGMCLDGILGAPVFQAGPILIVGGALATVNFDLEEFAPTDEMHLAFDEYGRAWSNNIWFGESKQFALLDTGCLGCVTLSGPLFDGLVGSGDICETGVERVLTANGTASLRSGFLKSMKFGSMAVENVPVWRSSSNTIGIGFLKNMDIAIDLGEQRLLIRKKDENWSFDARENGSD